jgi:hypothetical protein
VNEIKKYGKSQSVSSFGKRAKAPNVKYFQNPHGPNEFIAASALGYV